MPVGFEYKINQARKRIRSAGARDEEQLLLSDMVSSKRANVLFSVSSDFNFGRSEVQYLNGTFVSKVFCGSSYASMADWVHEMHEWVATEFGEYINPEKFFIFHPQTPSKEETTTYVVFFAQLKKIPRENRRLSDRNHSSYNN